MAAEYPKPSVTVDCVVFRYEEREPDPRKDFSTNDRRLLPVVTTMQVLLIERGGHPFQGKWALPGGFVNLNESLDRAAARELKEETALRDVYLEQLYTFGDPKRDPRGWVVSVAYMALLRPGEGKASGGSDARRAEWIDLADALHRKLAFDHNAILLKAAYRLRSKVRYSPILFDLLPKKFTIPEAQRAFESVLAKKMDARQFRRRLDEMKFLVEVGTVSTGHRPATLYSIDRDAADTYPDFRL